MTVLIDDSQYTDSECCFYSDSDGSLHSKT